jgi:choline dehydrogenase
MARCPTVEVGASAGGVQVEAGEYDVIIVGSGSSGGALAGRLSADRDCRVLVLDAGPVYRSEGEMPDELLIPVSAASAAPGNDLWSYEQVLPFFKRGETDRDFDDEYHGTDGPIPVQREALDRSPVFTPAFTDACRALGFADAPDKNAPDNDGVGPVPFNIRDGHRVGTAVEAEARTVLADTA